MTGLVRKALLLAVCGLLAASTAMAHVPDPANSECHSAKGALADGCIEIVGHDGSVGDPQGEYCVTVRDFNNIPIENSSVVLDFSNCDMQLCTDQKDPDVIVDCVSMTVRKLTDASGIACFRVIGKSRPGLECTGAPNPCAEVFADGVFLCTAKTPTYDLINEAAVGVSGNDGSELFHLFFDCGGYLQRCDYNCDDQFTGDDASKWFFVFFEGKSAANCAPGKDVNLGPKCP